VKRNQILVVFRTFAFLASLIWPGVFWQLPECEAQKKLASAEYDYYSLALTSISNSARDASKLPDIPQRVNLLLYAARILAPSQPDEATRLLDVALRDLKQWASEDKASWYQRHTAATLRNEVLALLMRVNAEKASILQTESQADEASDTQTAIAPLKSNKWSTQFIDRRTIADQSAKLALSLVDSEPEKALALAVQSVQGGTVSGGLIEIVEKLIHDGNRPVLKKLEIGIGGVLAASFTLDPISLSYSGAFLQTDKDMPSVTRRDFISFFMRSVQLWSELVREASASGGLNSSYINATFTVFTLGVRPSLLMYAPEQSAVFDSVLDQLGALVPETTRSRLQAFQPEKLSDPRDRLNDILKDPNPGKRDLRLNRLVSELLRHESGDFQKNLELASDAISGFSDPDAKSAYTDLLTITRIDELVKEKKFIEAQQFAGSISSEEVRAWALLALSSVAAKSDRVLGFELISNALKALEKASPSPHKVELALMATAMLAKSDTQRAFETLSTASKYANSSTAKVDPPTKQPFAFGLDATIGEAHTRLGVFPESLGELKFDPSLASLATTDWFRADQIASDIREPALRLQLKLQLAGAILAQESKPKRKETAPNPSAKN
jgi:hypothetical protein